MRAGEAGRGDGPLVAALDGDLVGVAALSRTAGDGQPRHRADRGQGLAAEAEGRDTQQVDIARVVGLQLGGGVAFDGQRQLVRRHPMPVVGDQDPRQPAAVGLDLDPRGTGVERILDQFLDGAGRAFDHLAGGDAVDGFRGRRRMGMGFGSMARSDGWKKGAGCGSGSAPHGGSRPC